MELFEKGIPNNLSRQSLKKAGKSKKKIEKVLAANLPMLVDFYFGKYQKGDVRAKYEGTILQLLGSHDYFVEPLARLVKKLAKHKELDELPAGLSTVLMDNLDAVRSMYQKQKAKLCSNDKVKIDDVTAARLDTMTRLSERLIQETTEICKVINAKIVKKLVKELGIERKYAEELACCYVPSEYLNTKNIRRYVYRLNLTLYSVQGVGVVNSASDDADSKWTNTIGANLSDPETIKKIYEIFFKGINRKTFISLLIGIMLERRGGKLDHFKDPQRWLYNDISTLVLNVLEGTDFINIEKEKLSKKKAKKILPINKKELKAFMKIYSDEKARDAMRNNDSPRRVSFTSLSEEDYPKIRKAFRSSTKDYFNDLFDDAPQQNQNHNRPNNQKGQNNNNRQNQNNNRRDK